MQKDLKELKALNKKYNISIKIDKNMPDLSNDPYVLAKKEKAEKLLTKYPVPESFLNKPNAKNKKGTVRSSKPKTKRPLPAEALV
jgi:hypothetical protein